MQTDIIVKDLKDLDELEAQIVRSGKALALELAVTCRRCIDDWDKRGEKEGVRAFLRELRDRELAYHPIDANDRTSVERQVHSTFAYLATISALKWLRENRPAIKAYKLSPGPRGSVLIESEFPRRAIAAHAIWCNEPDNKHIALLLNWSCAPGRAVSLSMESKARAKYVFVALEGAQEDEYEMAMERDGVMIMVQKMREAPAQDEKETA